MISTPDNHGCLLGHVAIGIATYVASYMPLVCILQLFIVKNKLRSAYSLQSVKRCLPHLCRLLI